MAEGISIVWDGLHEFKDRIDEIIVKADLAARKAVTDGGHLIERRSKQRSPVKTGTLRRSIHVDSVSRLSPGRWESRTGPSVIYARRIELGFHGADSLGRHYNQSGHPYMGPAFNESIDAVREIYRTAFREALES